jgi:hypothetical protein
MLVDESVLPAPLLYRPGEGLTGRSPTEKERSGTEVEMLIDEAKLSAGFRLSPSLGMCAGLPRERLDEPEVDTVESEEEEGWVGWPRRTWLA